MMANATELVKAMNVAVEDKDVHWTTEQVMQLFGEPSPQEKPSIANLNFYSGGAEGADTEWGNAIQAIGGTVTHYTTDFYDGLSQDEKDRLEKRYQEVRQVLGYHEANDPKTKKLLRRDMLQADNAKEVFAVGTSNQETQRVNGGTLYAVTRAQLSGKPIHVFNQADNKWYFYDYQAGAWWQEDTPTITQDAALIGTRGINAAGKQAIKDVIAKSTGQQPTTQQGPIQSPSTGGNRTAVKKGDIIRITELSGSLFGAELSGRVFDAEIANISPRINGFSLEYIDPKDGLTRNIESDITGNPVGFSLKIYKEVTDTKGNPITLIETPVVEPTKKELFREALNRVLRSINYYEGQIDYVNNRIRYNQATSADYNWKEECEQSLRKEQEILQAAEAGKAEVYLNAHQVPELRIVLEKPAEKNIIVETVYELSPVETEKEGYSQGYIIKKKNTEGTPKQGAAQIQRMIDHDELPLGAHIMWQGLTAEELSELNKVRGLEKNADKSWTVIYTEREMALQKQNNTLLKSPLFGSHELHKLAALTMFKLSEVITQLQEGTVNIEDVLWEGSLTDEIRNTDYKGMDRIDIINVISLDKLFNDLIREEIFNADVNERLQEDFDLAEKAQVIYDNFDALSTTD